MHRARAIMLRYLSKGPYKIKNEINNINSEIDKIWNNAEIISHKSHDQTPLNHGVDLHVNFRELLPTDSNDNSETLSSLNDLDNSNNINNNFLVSNISKLDESVISNNENYTYMSIGQLPSLFLPKENMKESLSSSTINKDHLPKGNNEYNQQLMSESYNQYVRNNEHFLLTEEEIYNELETFSNTLSSPDLFASYIINLQYIEHLVQITPPFIFDKLFKNDRGVFRNLKSSYQNYLQYHKKSSFLQQGKRSRTYFWEYLIKLVSPTGYSPKYNNQIKYVIIILEIPSEQLDLENVSSILQQKYLESKPSLNSYLERLVKILRKNLNRFSSIQYKELDIIDETVKQYQAGKCINNIFNKSSTFNKSKNHQGKGTLVE
ncbi:hypothetical protein Glove_150g6 [Diversispora epigaea]|uniref:Uncharacterized protein n=1 Tax=Diversispora epigaea TaxID=1348612 RepID=A0A397ITD6_9GLOM|nr:hypothetical protein Glove_150g6 [Diversispora epigaea]